jgi:hypothetical protein
VTSLPPDAAGRGDADRPAGAAGLTSRPPSPPPAAGPSRPQPPPRPPARAAPPPRVSNAPVELSLDLRFTPPDKVLARLFGALERIGADVTLVVLLRDTPEYASIVASAYQALRSRGYASDSARFPPGGQRLRVHLPHERAAPRPLRPESRERPDERPDERPAPPPDEPPDGPPDVRLAERPPERPPERPAPPADADRLAAAPAEAPLDGASGHPVEGQTDLQA